jgi:hypothetical protein
MREISPDFDVRDGRHMVKRKPVEVVIRSVFGDDFEEKGETEDFEAGEHLSESLDRRFEKRHEEWEAQEHSPAAEQLADEYADCDEARYELAGLYAKSAPLMVAIHGAIGEYAWDEGDWREVLGHALEDGTFDQVQARKYREALDTRDLILETIECAGIDRVRKILKRFDRDIFGGVETTNASSL